MKLEYEDIVDYKVWYKKLVSLSWLGAILPLLAECVVFLLSYRAPGDMSAKVYTYTYILRPGIINVTILIMTGLISNILVTGGKYTAQAFVYISALTLVCFVIAITRHEAPLLCCLFVLPSFVSLVFADRRILNFAFCAGAVAYCLLIIAVLLKFAGADISNHSNTDIIATIALLGITFFLCHAILKNHQKLITALLDKNIQSKIDNFTKLYNHASFYEYLDEHIIRYNKTGAPFSVILMDLDDFKPLNDQLGHQAGDDVLMICVDSIKRNLGENDIAFRYGGEEFAIITSKDVMDSFNLSEKVRHTFAARTGARSDIGRTVTVSLGICQYDSKRFGARREFFAAVDEALYKAKRSGKNQSIVWNPKFFDIQPNI